MLRIRPFRAVRPEPSQASRVASPPYDVVSTDEARAVVADNPLSFLRVVRPEVDFDAATDPYDDRVYEQGRANLDALLAKGDMVRDTEPRIYLYRQVQGDRRQVGVVCCCAVEDYERGLIKKHEKTRRVKEDDRTRHVQVVGAHTGPVFMTYRGETSIDELIIEDLNERPLYHFDAPDHVTHTVWQVVDPSRYVEAFSHVPCSYVADGHHRSASAARGAECRAANAGHTGHEEYNWFLAVLFPARDLSILPYNRVVRDLGGRSPAQVRSALGDAGRFTPTDSPAPDRSGVFCIYLDRQWHRLELDPASIDATDPVASLDAALLQERVLGPILDIGDPRTDERIGFIGGIRGTAELEHRVDSGQDALAISMYATSIDQLLAVADAGLIMPPKSTWFEPKLRSGVLVHEIERSSQWAPRTAAEASG